MRAAARCGRPRPRGWAGPGPHLDPTSAPSHILAAQVTGGGGGRGELRARRGRGSRSAHRQDRAVARPRLGRGRDRGQRWAPLVRGCAAAGQSGPQERPAGLEACARQWACPLGRREEGRKLEPRVGHADARRPEAVGWGGAAPRPLPPPGTRGVFSFQTFCTVTALSPGVEANAREGVPLSLQPRPRGPPGMGALRRGSPPLFPSRARFAPRGRRVRSGEAQGCRPRLGAERLPPHPPQPGSWVAAP